MGANLTQAERLAVVETKVDNIEKAVERHDVKLDQILTAVGTLTAAVNVSESAHVVERAANNTTRVMSVVARWGALVLGIFNTVMLAGVAIAAIIAGR